MSLFDNRDVLHRDFLAGLQRVLQTEDLGAFILVLANSLQDQASHDELIAALRETYCKFYLHEGAIEASPDDLRVFERICGMDIDDLSIYQHRLAAPWQLILNPMRALRPPRAAAEKIDNIKRAFDDSKFNFNRAFLTNEILAESEIEGHGVTVLYNKFPFLPYHTILVPDRQSGMPQFLSEDMHEYIWRVTQVANEGIEGYGFGYNSIGAGASVNHLHFQGFIAQRELPVERGNWEHNGGEGVYPLPVERYENVISCWQAIDECQQTNQPFNLMYRDGATYLFRRCFQGDAKISERFSGAGFSDLAGVLSLADESAFESLTEKVIYDEMATLATTAP